MLTYLVNPGEFEKISEWYAVMGYLKDPHFLEQVGAFVSYVDRYKAGNGKDYRWRFSDDTYGEFAPETGGETKTTAKERDPDAYAPRRRERPAGAT